MKRILKSHIVMWITVLVLAVTAVGVTLALMTTSSQPVANQFTAADVHTEIVEDLQGNGTKKVSIQNNGPSDAYVRVRVMVSGASADQVEVVTGAPPVPQADKVYLVMPNSSVWAQTNGAAADDFYYYLGVVKAGESTENLLEKVVFGDTLNNDADFLAGFNITVSHESVMATGTPEKMTVDAVKSYFDAAASAR